MPDLHHMTIISDFLLSVWLVTSCHQVIFVAFHRCSVNGGVVSRQSAFAWHFHHLNICFFSFHIEMVRLPIYLFLAIKSWENLRNCILNCRIITEIHSIQYPMFLRGIMQLSFSKLRPQAFHLEINGFID